MRATLSLAILTILIAACGNYQEVYNKPGANVNKDSFKTLSFAAVETLVFQPYCVHCHGNTVAKKNLNLTQYQAALGSKDQIMSDVMGNAMPLGEAPVPDDMKSILAAWINAGAPMTSTIPMPGAGTPPPPPPPPPTPGFDQLQTKVFEPYCSRCHAPMMDAATVKSKIADIQAALASDKMPKDSDPLPPELKKMLNDWVTAGMPMGFDEVKHKLFVPYCVRCHASFSDYTKTAKRIDEIQEKIETDDMPKNGPALPAELKQLLSDWVKAGMPN